tara:strand:- start:1302 stop:1646 length:345 start_codon:yes stop_codon:yes gene_type:complete
MRNRFNINESEKNLIRGLHGMQVLTEQSCEGDCENGQGTYTYASGNKYVGEYKDGLRHGQGTYTWPATSKSNIKWLKGHWIEGRLDKVLDKSPNLSDTEDKVKKLKYPNSKKYR